MHDRFCFWKPIRVDRIGEGFRGAKFWLGALGLQLCLGFLSHPIRVRGSGVGCGHRGLPLWRVQSKDPGRFPLGLSSGNNPPDKSVQKRVGGL